MRPPGYSPRGRVALCKRGTDLVPVVSVRFPVLYPNPIR
jgi:hypothetical protein